MKPAQAVPAFQEALKDEQCCEIPMTHALLGQSLYEIGEVTGAMSAFVDAEKEAPVDPAVVFQIRRLHSKTVRETGRTDLWLDTIRECAESGFSLERAWGLEQQAEYAWYQGDSEVFAQRIGQAAVALSAYDASSETRSIWEETRYKQIERHLGYAAAVLEGSDEMGIVFDYETSFLDTGAGNLEAALNRLDPWVERYPLDQIDTWSGELVFWGQRTHLFHNSLLGRMGRLDEAVRGFQNMLANVRDSDRMSFEPHIYCHLAYCLMCAGRLQEAREAYEMGLSVLEIPGQIVDPTVAYCRGGRIATKARMMFVENFRSLTNQIAQKEGK
jgi:tetratricopeptide (TPR) repeat protein